MTDPTDPIPTPSRAAAEYARLLERIAEVEAQLEAERQARDAASPHVRALAIALHADMCMEKHDGTGACNWYNDAHANDPEAADWTRLEGWRWLLVASAGIHYARQLGWVVEEPPAQEA